MARGKKTGGRKKGQPNKATAQAREVIGAFVEEQAPRLNKLLAQIEAEHGALTAYNCILALVEYHVPRLQRTDINANVKSKSEALVRVGFVPVEPADE